MKYYRIKLKDDKLYVRCIMIGDKPFIKPAITLLKEEATIYEEDKANYYLETLNEEFQDSFELEETKMKIEFE